MFFSHTDHVVQHLLTRLGLSSVSTLLAIVTSLTLGIQRGFSNLVLGDLVDLVFLALWAVGTDLLGEVNLWQSTC